MTRANAASASPKPTKPTDAGCPPPAPPPPHDCGCKLECIERPVYFGGHLLTDADLTLEQRYLRGKNRLYHRTLHGHGIVCGLRLTCDPDCAGRVRIEDGFAIDACGNDLVACDPIDFDVIARLREKNLLVKATKPPQGDQPGRTGNGPGKEPSYDCNITQCFHVAIRYAEEKSDYTTPLGGAGCGSEVGGCEPTRVREGVSVDVLEDLPRPDDPLDGLIERIEHCFGLFREGPFAQALKGSRDKLQGLAGGGPSATKTDESDDYGQLFRKLRALFLLHLEKCPDTYDCSLVEAVEKIAPGDHDDYGRAICALLSLAWRSAIDCALGALVPRCREPECAGWVVLGTVEIENGRVVRVCNCPRSYVWSFANFFEVLLATLYGGLACTDEVHGDAKEACYRKFKQEDCAWFLKLLGADPAAPGLSVSEPVARLSRMRASARAAFDFTRPGVFSPRIVEGLATKDAQAVLAALGIAGDRVTIEAAEERGPFPFEVLQAFGLVTARDRMTLAEGLEKVEDASIDRSRPSALRPDDRKALDQARQDAASAQEMAQKAAGLIDQLQKKVDELEKRLQAPPAGGPTEPPHQQPQ